VADSRRVSTLFISHSSRDEAAARELKARLEAQGHRSVFLDFDPDRGIQSGTSWERTLYTKLRACRAVVALCSDHYLASHWCFAEIALARMEGKEVFVLQIDPWSETTRLPSILTEEQAIDLRAGVEVGYRRLWNGFRVKGIVAEEEREWGPDDPPYPGLRAFEERDAPIFFGRDEEIAAGVELLTSVRRQGHPRLVMVLGSSGSGKSSLARAGVVPRLRRDRDRWWLVGPFRPGREPARELAGALSRAFAEAGRPRPWEELLARLGEEAAGEPGGAGAPPAPAAEAGEGEPTTATAREKVLAALQALEGELAADDAQVAASVRGLKELLAATPAEPPAVPAAAAPPSPAAAGPLAALASELRLAGGSPEASVVLVIDQFEELLGHEREGPEHPANRFLALLRDGIESDDAPPLALATMRSDFLGVFQRSPPLLGVGFKSLSVGPMARDGMRRIVEEPARLGQLQLEAGLTDLLLDDTATSDALPLLAFTLRAMWDRYRDDRLLEIREYRDLGGLQGAVAQVADETLESALALGSERDLRDAFLRLARPAVEGSGWARQPVSWEELGERVRPMLRRFVDQRLLVTRGDGTVEVAHETLFRSWAKLRGWLDENAEGLHLLGEIRTDAAKWERTAGDEEKEPYLWRGGRLARALELRAGGVLAVAGVAGAFIDASARAARAQAEAEAARQRRELRRARVFAAVVGAALLVALGLWRVAVQETERAREAVRAATARSLLAEGQPTVGGLMALEVRDPANTPTAVDALHQALAAPVEVVALRGHADIVYGAWWSADGRRVVTASEDGTARVWDAAGGTLVATLSGHRAKVGAASFSPDGMRVATASDDGTARLWDAATGAPVATLEGHTGWVAAAAFSPDGGRLVTAGQDGTARVWDAADGAPRAVLRGHLGPVRTARFSADGARVLTGSDDGTARLWDAASGAEVAVLRGHAKRVRAAVFSADGRKVATASDDGTARVWDAGSGRPLTTLAGHDGPVYAVAFSPDGREVATASDDGTARLWNAASGGEIAVLPGHRAAVRDAAFSPDGGRVVTASFDHTARLWDAATGAPLAVFSGHTEEVRTAAFSPDGRFVLTASDDKSARIWSPARGEELAVLSGHGDPSVYAAAFSPDGSRVVTACDDGTARLWDPRGGPPLALLAAPQGGEMRAAAFSPDGARVVTGSRDGTARVWDVARGAVTLTLAGQTGWLRAVAFSPDGGRILTAGDDGTARIWDAATGAVTTVLAGDGGRIFGAAFSPDGRRVVTAGDDGTGRIWDAASGAALRTLSGFEKTVRGAAFSPDGRRVVTASEDHVARLWDAATGAVLATLSGHTDWVQRAAFSPDGTRIVTASDDGTARVWSAAGEPLFTLVGHSDAVHDAAFSPDGARIVTAADDGTARVWADPPEVSRFLRGRIRARNRTCLPAEVYRQSLGESTAQAERDAAACARCVPNFFTSLGKATLADWPLYVAAWDAYERCLDR
jgi:WD40 repeat protein